jgi:hypothetical protein
MGSKTAYLAQKVLDHMLGGPVYTPPTTVYMALSIAAFDPNAVNGGSFSEIPFSGSYARLVLANNTTVWTSATAASPSEKHNINDLAWVTATGDWGQPLSAYLVDASTGGNLLYGSDITNPQPVGIGDTAKIAAGGFVFNET